jgi:hypothetical protein
MTAKKRLPLMACVLALGLACAAVAPVAMAEVLTAAKIDKPADGAHLLLVKPEVSLDLLTASGMREPKVEWSQNAQTNLAASLTKALQDRKLAVDNVVQDTYDQPRAIQILKLNEVVTASIYLQRIPAYKLPTKSTFDWTVGPGVATLLPAGGAPETAPKYALFLKGEGSFSSGGRAAMMVGMAILGAGMPMGGQYLRASLVDLQTGQVVWADFQIVSAGTDIRTPGGADEAVTKLLKTLPF